MYLEKYTLFHKSISQKLETFSVKIIFFGVALKNYSSEDVAQSFYRCKKVPSFTCNHVLNDLVEKLGRRSSKSPSGRFPPGL